MPKPVPFILLLLVAFSGWAQPPVELSGNAGSYRVDAYVDVFIDSTQNTTIDQVREENFQSKFVRRGNLTFGYMKNPIWLKIRVHNLQPSSTWLLEIPAPFLEYVDFYQISGNTKWVLHSKSGYFQPQSVRPISHTGHVVPLMFQSDSTTVYIKIAGESPKTFPLYIIERENFYQKIRFEDIGYGIFFGILIVMFFFNLFIFLVLKQTNYLLYIFTIVCTFLIFVSATGYAGKFLWPEFPQLNFYAGRMPLGVLTIFLAIFTIRFLNVKQYSKVMYYALLSLIPLGLLAMILVATNVLSSAGNNLISISILIYLATGIVCRINGNKTAIFFIAAWTLYFVGGLMLTLRNSGVFDYNFWTTHFVEIGVVMETVIIAFALGDQYRSLRLEKEAAQMQALKIQLSATEKLELKVAERTEQLSKANIELQSMLERNTLQTKIIEDKNAELDAFFYRISHDLKGPVSSLLGLLNIAKMEVSDDTALEYLDKQQKQVERLNTIITGLINLTKLGGSEINNVKIDFNKLIDDCISSFQALPNFHNITFKKEMETVEFYSEWSLVNAILQNLIENGIKYSGRNEPFLKISVKRESQTLLITVEDNGHGIPTEYQSRIFDMFYRASNNSSGSGLGLYILKRSVDRLQGTIDMKSEVCKGSIFSVRLPFANPT